jgi:hypothetical protein
VRKVQIYGNGNNFFVAVLVMGRETRLNRPRSCGEAGDAIGVKMKTIVVASPN